MATGSDLRKIAVWAITETGAALAEKIATRNIRCTRFLPGADGASAPYVRHFQKLKDAVEKRFHAFDAHIFIMSTGIVVRLIAPLIRHKTEDPAVLVADEKGVHVISLLSGHIGGANALTLQVARSLGAEPVITTATDLHGVPAVDALAAEKSLHIENPGAIKIISKALLTGEPVAVHDPYGFFETEFKRVRPTPFPPEGADVGKEVVGLFVDDVHRPLPENVLVLRPPSLAVGIGCNRGTPFEAIHTFLGQVIDRFDLSVASIKCLASVDLKSDEPGLLTLGERLQVPVLFFSREELNAVKSIENPSHVVEKHIGVKSVCEAAAILGANQGKLIVPKKQNRDVTVAVARIPFTSSVSARALRSI